ncbi:MAG: hypothetical protein ACJZ46_03235 [Candidatus Thalassarchaeaceae archaeon]|tara:strand:- start:6571 stop:7527 length:957 start_codon:yes stop_codon:yes gene_type:complete
MSTATKFSSWVIMALFLLTTIPSVQSQGDIYPWDIEIEFENDDSSDPFDISEDGKATITFTVSNNGFLSMDLEFEYEGPFQGTYTGPSDASIPANSNESFQLEVTKIKVLDFPAKTQEDFLITAKVISLQGTPQISPSSKDAEGKLIIPIVYSLDLEIADPVGPMNAGTAVPLRVSVINIGNIEDRVGDIDISDNCPLLTPNNGLDSLMTKNLNPGQTAQADLELTASESHPKRTCKVEISIASNGAMNTGASSSLSSAEVQVTIDPTLSDNTDTVDSVDDTTTTTEVVGSSLPSSGLVSIILCVLSALVFTRRNNAQ